MLKEHAEQLRLVGRVLCGKWRLERLLGSGGMSSVYAAVHRTGKRVAIKVLSPDLTSNRQIRGRFMREGYIANHIGHPGAVAVLDDETDGELVFLVMELLDGETLAARAARLGGALPPAEVAFAAEQLLEVLAAAHASRVVHRDVKPENVFVTRAGEVKLLDFGIASLREISSAIHHTRTGMPLGTPGFMAPEQARGRWDEVDARTDLWAVGATMFRMLAGHSVHAGETANEVMIAAATQAAPSLATSRPDLPEGLVAVVDRALGFTPARRWQSARDMQQAVHEARVMLPAHLWLPPPAVPGSPDAGTLEESAAPRATPATVEGFPVPLAPSPTRRASGSPGTFRHPLGARRALWLLAPAALAVLALVSSRRGEQPEPDPRALVAVAPRTPPAPAADLLPVEPPTAPQPAAAVPPAPKVVSRPRPNPAARSGRPRRAAERDRSPVSVASPSLDAAPAPPPPGLIPVPAAEAAPPPTAARPAASGNPHIVSRRPRSPVPPPLLAEVYQTTSREDLARVCHLVEREAVERAGVTPDFALGITAPLRQTLSGATQIYPAGIYYYLVAEAGAGHTRATAAHRLVEAHRQGVLRRLRRQLDRNRRP